jgi:hypothetical protein
MSETVHIFCENCGSSCEVLFDREDDLQQVIFCPFCGEESLDEELIEPEELDEDELEDEELEEEDEEDVE